MLSESKLQKYRAKLPSSLSVLPDDCKKSIGKEFKEARKKEKLTQEDVALILAVDPKTIQRIEQGKFNSIQMNSFYNLAAIYDRNVVDFLPEDLARLTSPLASVSNDSLNGVLSLLLSEQQRRAIV